MMLIISILICLITIFICMNILSYHLNKIVLKHENSLIIIATEELNLFINKD